MSRWSRGSQDPDSPHACPTEDGYWDTSNRNNWHFVVSQCRILLLRFNPATLGLEYDELNAGPDRGEDIPHVQTLIKVLEDNIALEDDEMQARWKNYLKSTVDMFLVWHYQELGGDGSFNTFERTESVIGSHVEAYARQIGDIDDGEWAACEAAATEEKAEVQVDEEEDDDTDSLTCETGGESGDDVSTSSSEFEEDVDDLLADPEDLKEELDDVLGHTEALDEMEQHGEGLEVATTSQKGNLGTAPHWLDPESER